MKEAKKGKSKYAQRLVIRKRLSSSKGTTTFKGKNLPLPLPLFE